MTAINEMKFKVGEILMVARPDTYQAKDGSHAIWDNGLKVEVQKVDPFSTTPYLVVPVDVVFTGGEHLNRSWFREDCLSKWRDTEPVLHDFTRKIRFRVP